MRKGSKREGWGVLIIPGTFSRELSVASRRGDYKVPPTPRLPHNTCIPTYFVLKYCTRHSLTRTSKILLLPLRPSTTALSAVTVFNKQRINKRANVTHAPVLPLHLFFFLIYQTTRIKIRFCVISKNCRWSHLHL